MEIDWVRVQYRKKVPIHIFCYYLLFSNLLTSRSIRTSDLNCSLASGSHFCLLLIFSFLSFFPFIVPFSSDCSVGWFGLKHWLIWVKTFVDLSGVGKGMKTLQKTSVFITIVTINNKTMSLVAVFVASWYSECHS